jgi:hypothetical protein
MKRECPAATVHYESIMKDTGPRLNGKAIDFNGHPRMKIIGGNMSYCTECESIEQGTITKVIDGEEVHVCAACQSEEDTMRSIDEDAGKYE